MSKYHYEFKKKIVLEYIGGVGSFDALSKKYHIPSATPIKYWVKAYQNLGDKGLYCSRQQKKYTFAFKLHMVELYLSSEVSYQELALQEGIHHPAMITKWVNDYRKSGPDALRPKKKGRKKSLKSLQKNETTASIETVSVDAGAERIKQLEDELLKLRIENAYLKELRRLRLEEEALLKKKRELSTASEENLN